MFDVLAGVIHLFNECFVGKDGDCVHHFDSLALVIAKPRSRDEFVWFDEGGLVRRAGQVAEVLPEVVIAGGTGRCKEGTDLGKTRFQVPKLPGAAAEFHLI